jgi:sugar-specific transcriptional regulator TrmB
MCSFLYTPPMRRILTNLLEKADIGGTEIHLYLLLLKLRSATATQLITESGCNRMTVYRALKALENRGLLTVEALNGRQYLYRPLSLSQLVRNIDRQQRSLRRLELHLKNLDRFLPFLQLDEEEDAQHEPIEIRDGLDAFREEYLSFPRLCEQEYIHIGDMEHYWKTAQMTYECPEERNFIHTRLRRHITCRILNIYSPKSLEFQRNDSRELRTSRLVDELPVTKHYLGMSEKQATLFLCDSENPRAIVMRQPELVGLYHQSFEQQWTKAQV